MKHTYICTALFKDQEIGEVFVTESSRPSKVVKQIDAAFEKKYGTKFTTLEGADIRKLNKGFKIKGL